MDQAAFETKLNELIKEINTIPSPQREKLVLLAKQTGEYHKKLSKGVNNLQESLDYLRVSVKYLIFDLEATRRENTSLKKLLTDENT